VGVVTGRRGGGNGETLCGRRDSKFCCGFWSGGAAVPKGPGVRLERGPNSSFHIVFSLSLSFLLNQIVFSFHFILMLDLNKEKRIFISL
jgi:hypothetical protein